MSAMRASGGGCCLWVEEVHAVAGEKEDLVVERCASLSGVRYFEYN